MSAASDKARFYLEQSIPELQEFERKGLFSKAEIKTIVRKRSDYEHKINARGSSAKDYIRYADFEINLEKLRNARSKRLSVKWKKRKGPGRILFIFERATRKFNGDLELWFHYIEYAKAIGANKRLEEIFTAVLRLHPAKPELWIFAASHALQSNADMYSARKYMQRGLRFCKKSKLIWLEYARLEMTYVSKIFRRREILGLNDKAALEQEATPSFEDEEDVLKLPDLQVQDVVPEDSAFDDEQAKELEKLESSPVLAGALPIAIFDAAMEELGSPDLGGEFFELFATFDTIPCAKHAASHVLASFPAHSVSHSRVALCHVVQPIFGLSVSEPEFPIALSESLSRLRDSLLLVENIEDLSTRSSIWALSILSKKNLDRDVKVVLEDLLQRNVARLKQHVGSVAENSSSNQELVKLLMENGYTGESQSIQSVGSQLT